MRIPPWSVILSWPKPEYEHPETRGNALLILMIVFSVLVCLAIVGRYYSRIVIKHWFGWDDSLMVLAWIFTMGMNVVVILANKCYGWERHIWDVPYEMIQEAGIVAFTAKLLFVGASTFTRLSLVCFYYRLIGDSGISWFTYVLHGSLAFNIILGIVFTCLGIWLCVPVQAYWLYPPLPQSKCLNEGTVTLIVGIINCVADLLTTLLPIPLVMRLKMPLRDRIGVCILLSLGIVVTVAGIIRSYYIWQSLINSWDETWYSYPLWICAAVEIDVAVICACAPALKPLLHKPLARMASHISSKLSSHHTTHTTGGHSTPHSAPAVFPFAKRSGGESIWDGEEEYGMLRLAEKSHVTTIEQGSAVSLPERLENRKQSQGMGILKSQRVEQEVSYVLPANKPHHKGHVRTASAFDLD